MHGVDVGTKAAPLSRAGLTLGDGSETLLACRVPNLQLAALVVDHDLFDFEVDAVRRARARSASDTSQ